MDLIYQKGSNEIEIHEFMGQPQANSLNLSFLFTSDKRSHTLKIKKDDSTHNRIHVKLLFGLFVFSIVY